MRQNWHSECLHCGQRYYTPVEVVHNAGYDWADSSSYCPNCGRPQESQRDYAMHDGYLPGDEARCAHEYSGRDYDGSWASFGCCDDPAAVVLHLPEYYSDNGTEAYPLCLSHAQLHRAAV